MSMSRGSTSEASRRGAALGVRRVVGGLTIEERLAPALPLPGTDPAFGADVAVRLLVLEGEVDRDAARELRDQITVALNRYGWVVVDLDRVSLLDSAGIRALLASNRRARLLGGRLTVAAGGGAARRVLELTRVDRVLAVFDGCAEAVEACASGAAPGSSARPPAATAIPAVSVPR